MEANPSEQYYVLQGWEGVGANACGDMDRDRTSRKMPNMKHVRSGWEHNKVSPTSPSERGFPPSYFEKFPEHTV